MRCSNCVYYKGVSLNYTMHMDDTYPEGVCRVSPIFVEVFEDDWCSQHDYPEAINNTKIIGLREVI